MADDNLPTAPPALAEWIIAQHDGGRDRAEIVAELARHGLSFEAGSQLVAELIDAEEMGRRIRAPKRPAHIRRAMAALRSVLAACLVFGLCLGLAFLFSFLPALLSPIGLLGLGAAFAQLVATLIGVVVGFAGTALFWEEDGKMLVVAVWTGALLYYGAYAGLLS